MNGSSDKSKGATVANPATESKANTKPTGDAKDAEVLQVPAAAGAVAETDKPKVTRPRLSVMDRIAKDEAKLKALRERVRENQLEAAIETVAGEIREGETANIIAEAVAIALAIRDVAQS